jgi:hypothetical protein
MIAIAGVRKSGRAEPLQTSKGFVESKRGRIVGATALTGKAYSAKLKLE